jgi:outer membrane lipoprotein SlyB
MTFRPIALVCASVLVLPACVMTSTETRTWTDPAAASPGYERHGRVDAVREVIQRQHGDPVGGAVGGAVVGGIMGSLLSGGRGPAAMMGAIGGAAVGSAASQGQAEYRWYEVTVRFDDGGYEVFTYRDYSPFRPGDLVVLGPRGLDWAQAAPYR